MELFLSQCSHENFTLFHLTAVVICRFPWFKPQEWCLTERSYKWILINFIYLNQFSHHHRFAILFLFLKLRGWLIIISKWLKRILRMQDTVKPFHSATPLITSVKALLELLYKFKKAYLDGPLYLMYWIRVKLSSFAAFFGFWT